MLAQKKLIVLDFDGTIADTMAMGFQISNRLARRYGYKVLTQEEMWALRGSASREVLRAIGLPWYKVPRVVRGFRKEIGKQINALQPIKGMAEAVRLLHQAGFLLAVATSNDPKNVQRFLDNHSLNHCIAHQMGGIRIFGKGKPIRKLVRRCNLALGQAVMVGDETRDIAAARAIGVGIVAVAWGFNSRQALADAHPDHLVSCPSELTRLFIQHPPTSLTAP